MGYRNLNSGSIRQQRRQQSRLSTQAPVGGSSVGHGSGLRFYDGGELIIDGLNTGMRFRVADVGAGDSVSRLEFTMQDMTNISALPLIYQRSDDTSPYSLAFAGPLLHDSTARDGYGGSNLFLGGKHARLVAGYLGSSPAQIYMTDEGRVNISGPNARLTLSTDGHVGLYGPSAQLYMNADGSLGINDGNGRNFWIGPNGNISFAADNNSLHLNSNGSVSLSGIRSSLLLNSDNSLSLTNQHGRGLTVNDSGEASIQGNGAVYLGTGQGGAGYNSHSDGRFYIGSSGNAIIQGNANGSLSMWAPRGSQMNGDFTVAGEKNFIMNHPSKPGYTIKYASTESPVSGIEDRGRVTIGDDGTAEIVLPEHFTAIVKPDTDVDIILQPYGPNPAWCDPPTAEGTTVHGEPGTVVTWRAFAQRQAKGFNVVEKGTVHTPTPDEGGQ